ncbi:MAG: hypothetical protein CO079_04265 [Nitrosopumilales archaeon CG_4_9_14_0_8_um_filter_34_10]|nr:MAG: hypothetical protein CO079_04265 [Nitrosopumilales archaeon CG_4_9_14_0_8_um_filter_34_10]
MKIYFIALFLNRNFRCLINPYYLMAESDVASFVFWSVITAIVMGVTGVAYKSYIMRRKKHLN